MTLLGRILHWHQIVKAQDNQCRYFFFVTKEKNDVCLHEMCIMRCYKVARGTWVKCSGLLDYLRAPKVLKCSCYWTTLSMHCVALLFGFLGRVKIDRDASSCKLEVHRNIRKNYKGFYFIFTILSLWHIRVHPNIETSRTNLLTFTDHV